MNGLPGLNPFQIERIFFFVKVSQESLCLLCIKSLFQKIMSQCSNRLEKKSFSILKAVIHLKT